MIQVNNLVTEILHETARKGERDRKPSSPTVPRIRCGASVLTKYLWCLRALFWCLNVDLVDERNIENYWFGLLTNDITNKQININTCQSDSSHSTTRIPGALVMFLDVWKDILNWRKISEHHDACQQANHTSAMVEDQRSRVFWLRNGHLGLILVTLILLVTTVTAARDSPLLWRLWWWCL